MLRFLSELVQLISNNSVHKNYSTGLYTQSHMQLFICHLRDLHGQRWPCTWYLYLLSLDPSPHMRCPLLYQCEKAHYSLHEGKSYNSHSYFFYLVP